MKIRSLLTFALLFTSCCIVWAKVKVEQSAQEISVENGRVRIVVHRDDGFVHSLEYFQNGAWRAIGDTKKPAQYWDANGEPTDPPAGETGPKKGYFRLGNTKETCKVVAQDDAHADISVSGVGGKWFPLGVEWHFVVFDDQPGFYSYAILNHDESMPGAILWQTRFVTLVRGNNELFDTHVAGKEQIAKISTAKPVKQLMDATTLLDDGTVKTKYANSTFWAQEQVYGLTGNNIGLWSISASSEYYNAGPTKQGQTVHDNTLLRVMQSSHFGASPARVEKGQKWSKIYGPVLTYINEGADTATMLADATAKQKQEAQRWPYEWMTAEPYQKQRGSIRGTWTLSTGAAKAGAWVILGQSGSDWTSQSNGYMFHTHTAADGSFAIDKIRPGTYTLFISGADQPEDFVQDNIVIEADKSTDLGTITWPVKSFGKTLWQIGTFDRSAGEYRNGDDARHFEMFRRYPEQFPDDVSFTIGKSNEKTDWNYAHWSWFSKTPFWTIHFDSAQPHQGKATLTLGFASAQPIKGKHTNLAVKINGQLIDTVHLPKTGTAGYRGSNQDSKYNLLRLTFDAALLKTGDNQITLGHNDAAPFPKPDEQVEFGVGQVMYDAIRLEVAE